MSVTFKEDVEEALGKEFFEECYLEAEKIKAHMGEKFKRFVVEPDPSLVLAVAIGKLKKFLDRSD